MIVKLIIIAALTAAAVQGNEIRTSRQGRLNNYYLYQKNADGVAGLVAENDDILEALDGTLPSVVIVHGHGGDKSSTLNPFVTNAFFHKDRTVNDFNIIVVDWSDYTQGTYTLASDSVQLVGTALGEYLKAISEDTTITNKLPLNRLHIVGFNLGAHVAGYAGRALAGRVARITGLDPSRSQWSNNRNRLSITDAVYVEVIHTDGDGLLANGIGTAIGDADFFVNGGSNQPGCITHACSHNRAWEIFVASLERKEPLYGYLCRTNLQLVLNRCSSALRVAVGGHELSKNLAGTENIYRVNTGRNFN